jgi:hypothetical protein
MGEAGETHWWGIWRRASARWSSASGGSCPQPTAYNEYPGDPQPFARSESDRGHQQSDEREREYGHGEVGEVAYDAETDIVVAPLEIGHLRILEADAERPGGAGGRRSSILEHRRFSLIDPISKGKRRQSGVAVAPLVPMQMGAAGKRQRMEGSVEDGRHERHERAGNGRDYHGQELFMRRGMGREGGDGYFGREEYR